jgi:hypothetical protein
MFIPITLRFIKIENKTKFSLLIGELFAVACDRVLSDATEFLAELSNIFGPLHLAIQCVDHNFEARVVHIFECNTIK